jgi:hypothetical protein
MKKIVAILMAAVMCLSLVSVSAALDKNVDYSMVLKVLDAEGNVITEAAPGDEVYVGVYVYATEGKADVEIAKNSNATFSWNVCNDPALTAEYAGSEGETEYAGGIENGTGYVTDAGDFMAIFVDSVISNGITLSDSTPVSKVKYVLPAVEAEYAFFILDAYASVNDGNIDIAPTLDEGVVLTVKEGAPANPTVGDTTAASTNGVAGNGKIYDNAMAVSAAITAPTATEIGVVFAPKAWLGSNELTAVLDGARVAKKTGIVGGIETTLKAAIKDIPRALNDTEFVMVTRAYAYDGTTYTYANAAETTMLFTKTAE